MDESGGLSQRLEPRAAFTFLCDQLTHSAAGSGRVVLLSGGIASGKTYVQSQFLHHATESGAITLYAAGAPDEREIPGAALEALLSHPALPAELIDEPDHREVGRELLRLAADRPVVIGVDDLQFVDDTSLLLLLHLQRRIRSTRLLIVLNQSPAHRAASARCSQFTRQPHLQVVLSPLPVETIAELISDDTLAEELHELSAGNPMLVSALIDDYRGAGHPVAGPNFAKAVEELLNRADPPLSDIAGALAVLDTPASPEGVGEVAGVSADLVPAVLAGLTDSGLVAGGRFRHPAIAAAVREALPPETRSRLHLRAASLRRAADAPAEEIAGQLVAAGDIAGEWSIGVLTEAAERAVRSDDMPFATRCLELAVASSADEIQRGALRRSLAGVIWRVNPGGAHQTSLRQAVITGTATIADAGPVLRQALWLGDRKLSGAAFDTLAAGDLDPRTAAELRLAHLWHYGTGRPLPVDGADPWAHTATTLARLWSRGGGEAVTAGAERILQNCRLGDTSLEALATAITALAWDDKGERAEKWCSSLREEARRRGALTWQALIDAVWSGITLRGGDVAGAASRAKSTLDLLDQKSWGVAVGYPLTTLLVANTMSGAFRAAADVLRHPVPEALFDTVGGLYYLRARGYYHLATNRVLAAVSDFQQCRRLVREWEVDLPALVPWRTDLAEANLRLGEPRAAADLAKQQLELAPEIDACGQAAALRVLAFVGDPGKRVSLLQNAAELFKNAGNRLELGKTARALAQLRQRRGEGGSVPPPVAEPKRMRTPEKPAAAPKVKVDAEPAVLSESEMRVAQLAALGHTNRQIASTLFITMSTVEQHLTRVYRKLGVPGRSALPADLAEDVAPVLAPDMAR